MLKFIYILIFLIFSDVCLSDEIIRDGNGNYYLMKDDGSFKRLPPPKPGKKYVIKKKIEKKESDIRYLKKNKTKSRFDTRSARKHLPGINTPGN
tara:strand:- start:672 stop:953 length:282 start_codon:yes stop_codon:yes gene_type:complete